MKWINLLGLILQFVAFWLAAPELLGKATLERFENGLKRLVTAIPMIVFMAIVVIYTAATAGYGIYKGLKGANEGLEEGEMLNYFIVMGVAFVVYFVFLLFSKRLQRWLRKSIADPLVDGIINQGETRTKALVVGALFFTVGFLFQVVALILA